MASKPDAAADPWPDDPTPSPLTTEEIDALARAAGQGDEVAFTRLYQARVDFAYRVALRFLREPEDGAVCEDVVADAWLSLWLALPRYPVIHFDALLARTVSNKCRDVLRRRRVLRVLRQVDIAADQTGSHLRGLVHGDTSRNEVFALLIGVDPDSDPADIYADATDREQVRQDMQAALAMLSAREQEVLRLQADEMGTADIGERLGIGRAAAKSRTFRARSALRSAWLAQEAMA